MHNEFYFWVVFFVLILTFIIVDLGLLNKTSKNITLKSALYQTLFWIFIAIGFGIFIYFFVEGDLNTRKNTTLEYYTAWLMEYALSIDNIFVILLILQYFKVKEAYYHKILIWGILGALLMRGGFIAVASSIVQLFEGILILFGLVLFYSGLKLFKGGDEEHINPEKNLFLKFLRNYLRFTPEDHGDKFYIRKAGKLYFTTLFLVIILIESTDLLFALDSIPAAFAITRNTFVIYTSNIFAIMGLRAVFFLLASILPKFHLLQKGLSIILIFIGLKMVLECLSGEWFKSLTGYSAGIHLPPAVPLIFITLVLSGSVIGSRFIKPQEK